jgi:hypothetical protein
MLHKTVNLRLCLAKGTHMVDRCAWIIGIGDVEPVVQLVATQLKPYGISIKGQKWPLGEKQAWRASAQEAAGASGRVVIIVASTESYNNKDIRRELALFRIMLQTFLKQPVAGFVILTDPKKQPEFDPALFGINILEDWEVVSGTTWPAKVIARLHAPKKSTWPIKIEIFAQEKLGVWISVNPEPGSTTQGCVVGVSGNNADISFHAVGLAGRLPERSVNEYEIKGLEFDFDDLHFKAWAVQNKIGPDDAYYVRIEGEPDVISAGGFPNGEIGDLALLYLK